METLDVIREPNPPDKAQLRQRIDELSKAGDIAFDLQGACGVIEAMIQALVMPGIKGETVLKARALGFISDTNHAVYQIYSLIVQELTAVQVTLEVLEGGEGNPND